MNLLMLPSLPLNLRCAAVTRNLLAGEPLFWQGDRATAFFVVESGRIKVARYTPEGRAVMLQVVSSGESVGENALLSDVYASTAIAEVTSRVIAYPKKPLLLALRNHPHLAEDVVAMLVRQNQALKLRLELRDIRAAHERVLQYLRYLAERSDRGAIVFDRPLKDIAADLGFTPETMSRALAKLERDGVITRQQSCITLHDVSAA